MSYNSLINVINYVVGVSLRSKVGGGWHWDRSRKPNGTLVNDQLLCRSRTDHDYCYGQMHRIH